MGQRERRRQADTDRMAAGYARGRAKDEEARARLVPLAPGERPRPVTIAAAVALLLAVLNTAAIATGRTLAENSLVVSIAFSVVLLVMAGGLWLVRYWAVLGFQALLTIQMIIFFAILLLANDWWQFLTLGVGIALGGWLFWKLVGAMARIQMPAR
jgi:hypothetical protein